MGPEQWFLVRDFRASIAIPPAASDRLQDENIWQSSKMDAGACFPEFFV